MDTEAKLRQLRTVVFKMTNGFAARHFLAAKLLVSLMSEPCVLHQENQESAKGAELKQTCLYAYQRVQLWSEDHKGATTLDTTTK